ncbi:MAG TPA: hypothetical protein VKZ97_00490 [Flavobacteriaceae bacterium]|nr:hypothetical protein [Flavobacteriaceae bacterium]
MKPNLNNPIHTNVQFVVTKATSNPNGFLLPHILFDRIKTVATYPVKEFYLHESPQVTDYKFKMHKNAFLNDHLTIQAQLIQKHPEKLMVSVIVTKSKKASKTEETISSAWFDFPYVESNTQQDLAS